MKCTRRSQGRLLRTTTLALLAGCLLVTAAAPVASAQQRRPPAPAKTEDPPFLRTALVAILVTAGVLGAAMIPSKRGHQD